MANTTLHEPTPCENCLMPTRLSLAPLSHSHPRTRIPNNRFLQHIRFFPSCCAAVSCSWAAVQQASRQASKQASRQAGRWAGRQAGRQTSCAGNQAQAGRRHYITPSAMKPGFILTAIAPLAIALALPAAWADPLPRQLELSCSPTAALPGLQWTRLMYANGAYML